MKFTNKHVNIEGLVRTACTMQADTATYLTFPLELCTIFHGTITVKRNIRTGSSPVRTKKFVLAADIQWYGYAIYEGRQ